MDKTFPFSSIAIIGPGLMGGSIALSLIQESKKHGNDIDIRVWGRQDASLDSIRAEKLPITTTISLAESLEGAEIVIFCTPVKVTIALIKQYHSHLAANTIVTDVGSTKASLDKEIGTLLAGKTLWCGSHPMAGSDQSGFAAATPTLYQNATTILTPTENFPAHALEKLKSFWTFLGCKILTMPSDKHDFLVSQISHFPHLLAFIAMNCTDSEAFKLTGPGFRDFTRIAASPSEIWLDILLENQEPIVKLIDKYIVALQEAKLHLKQNNISELEGLIKEASENRKALKMNYVSN